MRRRRGESTSEPHRRGPTRLSASAALTALLFVLIFASASPAATLHVRFEPERSGPGTTLDFGFSVGGAAESPSPLTTVSLRFPPAISYATSALGTAECDAETLLHSGLGGCPLNSRIGSGTATVRVPFGIGSVKETVNLTLLVGHTEGEVVEVLYNAVGTTPVISRFVFRGELGSATAAGGMLTQIPPIATLPGAPNASVVSLHSRIDPPGLTYTGVSDHRAIHYHPRGIIPPRSCPPGGYAFSALFGFQDLTTSRARSTAPCQA